MGDLDHQAIEVLVLVLERVLRDSAALGDLVGELHHLVDRLAAGQVADVAADDLGELLFGLA